MSSAVTRRVCAFHPGVDAFASCRGCRKAICRDCASEWDGILHCSACVAQRRRTERGRAPWVDWIPLGLLLGLLLLLGRPVIAWSAALLGNLLS